MSNDKTFTMAGVSRLQKGQPLKFRTANGDITARKTVLAKGGQEDINLVALPHAMTKLAAAQHLIETVFQKECAETQATLAAAVKKYQGEATPPNPAQTQSVEDKGPKDDCTQVMQAPSDADDGDAQPEAKTPAKPYDPGF